MEGQRYIITSDIHIGCKFSLHSLFADFLKYLADDVQLILAGDVIDGPSHRLNNGVDTILALLADRLNRARIVWIEGNHDEGFQPDRLKSIEIVKEYSIGNRVYICHGDRFDNILPRHQWFVALFRLIHWVRVRLGAPPVHVALYAKRFKVLYDFLCRHVRENAVQHGLEIGAQTVVCGHVHAAEDVLINGIRYINLGSWTEKQPCCLLLDESSSRFLTVDEALHDRNWFPERKPAHRKEKQSSRMVV
jgi:UDP-2,3-diacylglucosamine pyrophosphatase LpxH